MPWRSKAAGPARRAAGARYLLAGPLLAGLLAGLAPDAAWAATAGIGRISGLPWSSGINGPTSEHQAFINWRGGRLLDVRTLFFGIRDWTHLSSSAGAISTLLASGRGRPVIALGMLPRTHIGQLGQCANGEFDPQIRAVANNMLNKGGRSEKARGYPIVVRLGWEGNNEGSYPWAATGDGTSWRDCFRRWVDILNPVSNGTRQKNFLIVWNMANRGTITYPIDNLWPGGDYVDIVGSQYYDRCPPLPATDRYTFEARLDARSYSNNPAGPRAWLEYAKAKGKPWAVPEWGIGGPREGCAEPGVDNPYFIRKMYEFFWDNAGDMAFEAYFNETGGGDPINGTHEVFAPTPGNPAPTAAGYDEYVERYNPGSAEMYQALWGGARPPVREPPPSGPPEPPPPPPATDELYWLRYIASYGDLIKSIGPDAATGHASWVASGRAQKRTAYFDPLGYLDRHPAFKEKFKNDLIAATKHFITFGYPGGNYTYSNGPQYWLRYIASHLDLIPELRTQATAGEAHYYNTGVYEKRSVTFDALSYLKANAEARAACGSRDQTCATKFFINSKL